jgi:hypothetical protein
MASESRWRFEKDEVTHYAKDNYPDLSVISDSRRRPRSRPITTSWPHVQVSTPRHGLSTPTE